MSAEPNDVLRVVGVNNDGTFKNYESKYDKYGSYTIGRGDFDIQEKKCSRKQISIIRNTDNSNYIVCNGVNPSYLKKNDQEFFVQMVKDQNYPIENGDCFSMIYESFTFQVMVESKIKQTVVKPPTSTTNDDKKRKVIENEGNKGDEKKKKKDEQLPICPHGPSCYRKNPNHFEEYSHPWKNENKSDITEMKPDLQIKSSSTSSTSLQPKQPITQQQDNNNNNNINYNEILNSMNPIEKLDTNYWSYIEHPVQIAPIINTYKPAPMRPDFLLLTKEKKQIRKKRREEEENERRERVLNGLEAPPENKVKLSNLMRVITNKGIQDPTQAVLEVTKRMDERRAVHDANNAERKLSKEQRKEKKVHKLIDDSAKELYCAIFKITDLSHPLLRSKVTQTAKDNLASGCIIFHRCMNLVIFECGHKAMKKCKKLLSKRIDWSNPPPLRDNQLEEMSKEENAVKYPQAPPDTINSCTLIWEGPIHKPRFTNFIYEFCPLETQARKYLEKHQVPHFWDMAKNFINQ